MTILHKPLRCLGKCCHAFRLRQCENGRQRLVRGSARIGGGTVARRRALAVPARRVDRGIACGTRIGQLTRTPAIENTRDYEGDPGVVPPLGPVKWEDEAGEPSYRYIPRYRASEPDTQLMIAPSEKRSRPASRESETLSMT